MDATRKAIAGCLIGTALGDALGLPCEGLSKQRQRRLFPGPLRHRFVWGRGMVSDDTEHTCLVAQALIASAGTTEMFEARLARCLRLWLLGLPAGVGLATLKATLRLWLGFGPVRSGVFSAGNGPAMRSALLGVACGHDLSPLRALVCANTRLTHTDPKAEHGALAVALAAHVAATQTAHSCSERFRAVLCEAFGNAAPEMLRLADQAAASAAAGHSTEQFAESLALGTSVSGYVYHTVPVALHAWLRHPDDFRAAVESVIRCGGDTDTTAAIGLLI